MPKRIDIHLPTLHPAQKDIASSEARFRVACCGRRFGKTQLALDHIVGGLLDGQLVGYFAPTYDDLNDLAWLPLVHILAPITKYKNETKRKIETITGGVFRGFTLEKDRPGQGRKFNSIVIDEAASVPKLKHIFDNTLRATLVDYKGTALFCSTPRGHNDFWTLYNLGIDPLNDEWDSFNFNSYRNPHIDPRELDQIKLTVPLRTWQQEYLAEFTSDGGQVFRGVDKVAVLPPIEPYEGDFVFGVDWGRVNDFTAISVMDINTRQQVCIGRFNQIGWTAQRNRLMTLYKQWKPFRILAEQNSIGDVLIEQLAQEAWADGEDDFRIDGFQTTAVSKPILIDELTTAIERGEIALQDDTIQLNEFKSYTLKRLPSGKFKFDAPSGGHDDTVIATALSYLAVTESGHRILWA